MIRTPAGVTGQPNPEALCPAPPRPDDAGLTAKHYLYAGRMITVGLRKTRMPNLAEVRAQLTGPGSPLEAVTEA